MAKTRVDEVLGKVGSDTEVIPRYDLVAQDGTVVATNVKLVLKNQVITAGMPVDKAAMDECLAASGTTGGSATALTLVQPNFALFDGALIRFKLHVDSGATPTINVNGTGAKALMQSKTKSMKAATPAGTWLTAIYSSTFDFFVLQGSSNSALSRYGNEIGQISTFELAYLGNFSPWYVRRVG